MPQIKYTYSVYISNILVNDSFKITVLNLYSAISLFGLVLRLVEPLSETTVTHRPQEVIIVGIYISSNIYNYYYPRQ